LYTHAGPEVAVASTKAFLAQITATYLLGLYLAQLRGNKYLDEVADYLTELGRIPARVTEVLARQDHVRDVARSMKDATSVLFLGRHVGYPVALEGALKLKELAYIHAEGFAAGELKHGPIALIDEGQPVFVVVPTPRRPTLHAKVISNIQEVRARGARTLVIAEDGDEDVTPYADVVFRYPATPTLMTPLVSVVPLQIFACELAQSVTVEGAGREHRGRDRRRRRRRVHGPAGAHPAAAGEALPPRGARAPARLAGRTVRGQGGDRQGARRTRRDVLAGLHRGAGTGRRPGRPPAGHRRRPRRRARRADLARVHLPRRRHRLRHGRRRDLTRLGPLGRFGDMERASEFETIRAAEAPLLAATAPDELMKQAAFAVATTVLDELRRLGARRSGSTVLLLVGGGNNGGDALYAGAYLARSVLQAALTMFTDRPYERGMAAATAARVRPRSILGDTGPHWDLLAELAARAGVWVDGLTGIGATGGLREPLAGIVTALVAHRTAMPDEPTVVAVDVPSGIGVDDGTLPGPVLPADVTVTMGAA